MVIRPTKSPGFFVLKNKKKTSQLARNILFVSAMRLNKVLFRADLKIRYFGLVLVYINKEGAVYIMLQKFI